MQTLRISGPSASWRHVSARLGLGLTAVATMLIPVLHFGRGETATHARLHLTASTVVMAVAALVAVAWRGPYRRFERRSRAALVYALCFLAGSQLAESAGALAWAADGVTVRSRALHLWHTIATVASGAALLTVALATTIAGLAIVRRLILAALSHFQPSLKGTP